jgi:hypothetical protein
MGWDGTDEVVPSHPIGSIDIVLSFSSIFDIFCFSIFFLSTFANIRDEEFSRFCHRTLTRRCPVSSNYENLLVTSKVTKVPLLFTINIHGQVYQHPVNSLTVLFLDHADLLHKTWYNISHRLRTYLYIYLDNYYF